MRSFRPSDRASGLRKVPPGQKAPSRELARYQALAGLASDLRYEFEVAKDRAYRMAWLEGDMLRLTGFSVEEVHARGGLYALVVEEDRGLLVEHIRWLLEGQVHEVLLRIRAADGTLRWLHDRARGLRNRAPGPITHFIGVVHDVTEAEQNRRALDRARTAAEEMSQLKSAVLANMSHEIRTPLASMIGFARLLQDEELSTTQQEFTTFIGRSGRRLLDALDAILNLTMLESGGVALTPVPVDLERAVQDLVDSYRMAAAEKNLAVELVVETPALSATLDAACLEHVLGNLLSNAIKFTQKGRIQIRLRKAGDQVQVAVADTGIGIHPDFMPRLFEPFQQQMMGKNRAFEGLGLGLAIAEQMAELLGGNLRVRSRPGEGSIFTLSVPHQTMRLVAMGEGEAPAGSTPGAGQASGASKGHRRQGPGGAPRKALVIEDTPDVLVLLKHFLGKGWVMTPALDDEAALAIAQQNADFDLVLLDINLGTDRTGLEVLAELRTLPGFARMPIVAVTAYALPGDRERFIAAGFDAYVEKPFTREGLHQTLQRIGAE